MTYIPEWFKTYVKKESTTKNIFLFFLAIIATGIGSFGYFPEPPPLMKKFFDNPKNKIFKWFLVFLLIWQGRFGEFTYNSLIQSFIGTVIIYFIYHTDFFQNKNKKYTYNL